MEEIKLLADGSRHVHFESIGSTNAALTPYLETLEKGERFWVTAGEQLSGKGRSGRSWVSKPGNLYASCGFLPTLPTSRFPELAFVAALSMAITLEKVCGFSTQVRIKWPNDILLELKKVSGILLETQLLQSRQYVIIGFGLNCKHAPDTGLYETTCLANYPVDCDPPVLFAGLCAEFSHQLNIWDNNDGFAKIRAEWLDRAVGIGAPIRVRNSKNVREGIFEDLAPDGRLMLRCGGGELEYISAGDIFFS